MEEKIKIFIKIHWKTIIIYSGVGRKWDNPCNLDKIRV